MTEPAGWTIDTFKEYFDKLREADKDAVAIAREADKEAVNSALAASEKAILKAEGAANDRFNAANEIRGAMRDAQETFANKEQCELQMHDIKRRLDALEKTEVRSSGSLAGAKGLWGYVMAGATLLLAFVAWANGKLG